MTIPGRVRRNIFYGLEVMELNRKTPIITDGPESLRRLMTPVLKQAASLQVPTLCIFAENDKMTPVKFGKALAAVLPDNELHIIADSGHTLPSRKAA